MYTRAALKREERGEDTLEMISSPDHNRWGKVNSVISMNEKGEMEIQFESYPPIPEDLKILLDSDDFHEEA